MNPVIDRLVVNKTRRVRENIKARCYHDRILLQSMDSYRTHEWKSGHLSDTEYFRQATEAGQFAAEIIRRKHSAQ